nr:MAG TPA: hypothetical protein [Caudoviricetes sp.]
MPGQTTNYALPTYEATDAADLTAQYNTSMGLIDANLKEADDTAIEAAADAAAAQTKANENATAITSLQTQVNVLSSGSFAPDVTDPVLTVEQLAAARVTAAGIIYYKEA